LDRNERVRGLLELKRAVVARVWLLNPLSRRCAARRRRGKAVESFLLGHKAGLSL